MMETQDKAYSEHLADASRERVKSARPAPIDWMDVMITDGMVDLITDSKRYSRKLDEYCVMYPETFRREGERFIFPQKYLSFEHPASAAETKRKQSFGEVIRAGFRQRAIENNRKAKDKS